MKILITTPGGVIGRKVMSELLAPEFSVRIVARNPSRFPTEIREQVEIVQGSTDDARTLSQALEGVEALYWCVPRASFQEANVAGHYERFARAASLAIREAATPRVVTISAIGEGSAGESSDLQAREDRLNDSGAAICHLRCGWLMENLLPRLGSTLQHGRILYPVPGDVRVPLVAATDIADVALRRLVRRDWTGIESIRVHGPEDVSFGEAAALFERILERPVRYEEALPDDYVRGLIESGASAEYARSVVEMFSGWVDGAGRAARGTSKFTARTPLAAWVRSELLPLLERNCSNNCPDARVPFVIG